NRHDARYILTAALTEGRMIVAVAPPFPIEPGRSVLGPLLRGSGDTERDALSVMTLPRDQVEEGGVVRLRNEDGWRTEARMQFSTGPAYLARYSVELPQILLAVARASLLTVLNLLLFLSFWFAGRALLGETAREKIEISRLVISFRARVTLALFGFFTLANALFGTVAFRTLEEASRRSAQVIAE
ncbi:MAG TPA: hypothetical protein DCS75_04310, partial [Gemmatimonadetes bacterium]|nr:hypothetical protein [Gemmatimonadota bacterium]